MAMAILLIGVTSVLGLLSFGAALSRTASLRTASAQAIEAVLADLEEGLFPLVLVDGEEVAGEPLPVRDRPVPGYPELSYSATAVPNPKDPIEYRVDVEIAWTARGARRSRSFSTLLWREVPFGERLRRRFVKNELPREAPESRPTETPERETP